MAGWNAWQEQLICSYLGVLQANPAIPRRLHGQNKNSWRYLKYIRRKITLGMSEIFASGKLLRSQLQVVSANVWTNEWWYAVGSTSTIKHHFEPTSSYDSELLTMRAKCPALWPLLHRYWLLSIIVGYNLKMWGSQLWIVEDSRGWQASTNFKVSISCWLVIASACNSVIASWGLCGWVLMYCKYVVLAVGTTEQGENKARVFWNEFVFDWLEYERFLILMCETRQVVMGRFEIKPYLALFSPQQKRLTCLIKENKRPCF